MLYKNFIDSKLLLILVINFKLSISLLLILVVLSKELSFTSCYSFHYLLSLFLSVFFLSLKLLFIPLKIF